MPVQVLSGLAGLGPPEVLLIPLNFKPVEDKRVYGVIPIPIAKQARH